MINNEVEQSGSLTTTQRIADMIARPAEDGSLDDFELVVVLELRKLRVKLNGGQFEDEQRCVLAARFNTMMECLDLYLKHAKEGKR